MMFKSKQRCLFSIRRLLEMLLRSEGFMDRSDDDHDGDGDDGDGDDDGGLPAHSHPSYSHQVGIWHDD